MSREEKSLVRKGFETAFYATPFGRAVKVGRNVLVCAGVAAPVVGAAHLGAIAGNEPQVETSLTVDVDRVEAKSKIISYDEKDDLRFATVTGEQQIDALGVENTFQVSFPNIPVPFYDGDLRFPAHNFTHNKRVNGSINANLFMPNDAMEGVLAADGKKADVIIKADQFIVEANWDRAGYEVNAYTGEPDDDVTDQETAGLAERGLKSLAMSSANADAVIKAVLGDRIDPNLDRIEKLLDNADQDVDRALQASALNSFEDHCVDQVNEVSRDVIIEHAKEVTADKEDIDPEDVTVAFEGDWTWNAPLQKPELKLQKDEEIQGILYSTTTTIPSFEADSVSCEVKEGVFDQSVSKTEGAQP